MDIHIPPQLKFLMLNIKNIIHTQLTVETHQIWQALVLKLFSANGFIGYLMGDNPPPTKFLTEDGNVVNPNPLYSQWILIDQNFSSAMCAMISQSILPYVLNLNTCLDIWETIEKQLQSSNRDRILQLKNELHNLVMGTKPSHNIYPRSSQMWIKLLDLALLYVLKT